MRSNSYLLVDLKTLHHNVACIQQELKPGTMLIPVLKGNAYGLGGVRIARELSGIEGIGTYAVSHVAEGLSFREAGIREEIMAMSLPLDSQIPDAAEAEIILTLGAFRQFEVLKSAAGKLGKRIKVQIKLDTGLHRIGFLPDQMEQLCRELKDASRWIDIRGTFSHFSSDDGEQMRIQSERFDQMLRALTDAGIDPGIRHIASSASLEACGDHQYDAVRVGRRLYMNNPVRPVGDVREAVSFRAFLTDIKMRKAGETLAYGGRTVLKKDTRVGVLSIGYGDGLNTELTKIGAPVLVSGQKAPFLAACMDQSFVDLDGIDCRAEDEVTLFGYDGSGNFLSSQEVAALTDSEGCDLTTALTDRVARIYRD